jgi:uncharacterized protein (TIGR01777 family)
MRIAITGAGGLVGPALVDSLRRHGHGVLRLVRRPPHPGADEIAWDPERGPLDAAALEGLDAFVHLAGEGIAVRRWSARQKARIRNSRVDGTRLVATTLAGLARPPRVLVSASAIGYYGDRGDEPLDETASAGRGFLPETCEAWERAADPARRAGLRVVLPRIGIVLSPDGGALGRMLPPFRMGLGGRLGSGWQIMSWIGRSDLVRVLVAAIDDDALEGPVNAVAPSAVSNAEFARTLGRVLHRPAVLPLPAVAIRLLFGEMGQALLLGGARVVPAKLARAGFTWDWPELEGALGHEIGCPRLVP